MAFYSKLNNGSLELRQLEYHISKIPKTRPVMNIRKISLQENLSELRKLEVIPRTIKKRTSLKMIQDQMKIPGCYSERRDRCSTIGLIPQLMINSTIVQKKIKIPQTSLQTRRQSQQLPYSNVASEHNLEISVQKPLSDRKQRKSTFINQELQRIHQQENLNLQKIQIRRLFQQFYQRVIYNYFLNILETSMGFIFSKIFNQLVGQKEMRILILGLDNSGKTTILYKLHLDEVIQTAPTMGFNVETVTYKNLKFQVWDLGGQNAIRLYWRSYYPNTNGIIYVIDSFDKDRLNISKDELVTLLQEDELKGVPLLVLANKQDMQGAMSESDIAEYLQLTDIKNRPWAIVKCSAFTGLGLQEGMEWIANAIKK